MLRNLPAWPRWQPATRPSPGSTGGSDSTKFSPVGLRFSAGAGTALSAGVSIAGSTTGVAGFDNSGSESSVMSNGAGRGVARNGSNRLRQLR